MSDLINKDQIRYTTNSFDCKTRTHEGDDDVQDSLPNRKFDVSVSSTKPCDRGAFIEVLDHSPLSIDMSLLQREEGVPCLWAHDAEGKSDKPGSNVLGRFCKPYLQGEQLRGTLILSEVEDDVLMKVKEGTITDISIGYRIKNYKEDRVDDKLVITVTEWLPREVSLCAIGLDSSVGTTRSEKTLNNNKMPNYKEKGSESEYDEDENQDKNVNNKKQSTKMPETKEKMPATDKRFDESEVNNRVEVEMKRVDLCYRVADQFNLTNQERQHFIDSKMSGEEMMEKILERKTSARQDPINMSPQDVPEEAKRDGYSLCGVIDALVGRSDSYNAGLVKEVSREMERQSGKYLPDGKLHIPWGALVGRTYATQVGGENTAHGNLLVSSPTMANMLIEALRPYSVVPSLPGLDIQSGLTDNIRIPRINSVSTPTNLDNDTAKVAESQAVLGYIQLQPHAVSDLSKITMQLQVQVAMAESIIRNDLLRSVATRMDELFFYGTGSDEVRGIANATPLTTASVGANGDALTGEMLIQGEGAIENQNVMGDVIAVCNSKTIAKLKSLREDGATGAYLWNADRANTQGGPKGSFRGIDIYKTNNIKSDGTKGSGTGLSDIFLFVPSYAIWASFGPGAVIMKGTSGDDFDRNIESLRLTTFFDVGIKHSQAFYYRKDIITT